LTVSGAISSTGAFGLTKVGSGKAILSGANNYSGTTTVSQGTLLINGNNSAATGVVTVASGATLGGTGTIGGAVTNNGTIAPGASVGTLNVAANFTDGANSIWAIELLGAAADKLAVTGNIDLTALDSLVVTGIGTGTSWIIGTYTGTESGAFNSITSGYAVTYTGGNITLNTAAACAPGDLNCDGHVNAQDYVFWRKTNGPAGDYTAWRQNFGTPPGSGSGLGDSAGNVPEPASLLLIVTAVVGALAFRRRR
jgi:autotransporter-associated beta strand protein